MIARLPSPAETETQTLNVSWTAKDKNDTSPQVYINGKEYSSWQTSAALTLEQGENHLEFKTVNSSGKQTVIAKTVYFNPPASKLTPGYVPTTTSASTITLTWTVSDKNDTSPSVYINDELQSSWQSSKSISLTKGANQITFLATNKYGKQTTVTDVVCKN
ncbi:hypothetical protein [Paenibacillus sp. y28]|uniref:hypothetical protein n=1 Tax=Paenibacillus sp. y28 TaxID=3129110 RepID=UPI003016BA31